VHVADAEISRLALESGCRHIEANEKFVQTTSEFLKVFKEHDRLWVKRRPAIDNLQALAEQLEPRIHDAWWQYGVRQAEKEYNEAKAALTNVERDALKQQDWLRERYQAFEKLMADYAEKERAVEAAYARLQAMISRSRRARKRRSELRGDNP
jgi:hypothetical protein